MHPPRAVGRDRRAPTVPRGHVRGERAEVGVERALPQQPEVREHHRLVDAHRGELLGARGRVPVVARELVVVARTRREPGADAFATVAELGRLARVLHVDGPSLPVAPASATDSRASSSTMRSASSRRAGIDVIEPRRAGLVEVLVGVDRPGRHAPHCSPTLTPMSRRPARLRPRRRRVPAADPGRAPSSRASSSPSSRTTSTTSCHAAPRRRARSSRSSAESRALAVVDVSRRGGPAARARGHAAVPPVHRRRAAGPTRSRTARTSSTPRATRSRTRPGAATERVYDLEVPRRDPTTGATRRAASGSTASSRSRGTLTWDGIVDPAPPFDAAPWKGGFMRWADATLPEATTPSARSRCAARATSAWAAAWTSTRSRSRASSRR